MELSESPRIELIHGDCMDYMKSLEDKAFELAIVDPPYGINRNGMTMGNSVFNKDAKKWDLNIPDANFFNKIMSVSVNQIIWGGNYFPLPQSQYFCIWDKGETMYGRDFAECEYAWVRSGGTRIFKGSPVQPNRIHPTQKPVALYKWLIKNYAKPGDRILDTHLGSGSSAIAAWEAGHDFVGIELDEDYYNAAVKRFRQHIAQTKLF
jgi:site-specific DNA-methyltransferase (adenine-specific)